MENLIDQQWQSQMKRMAQAAERAAGAEVLPLDEAVYCMDCDNISRRTRTMACLFCASESTIDLNKALNRAGEAL